VGTLLDEFKSITSALNDAGIEYAVCGGWAMAIHGLPRATMDIDLLILPKDLARVLDIARKNDFDIEGLPLHFEIEIRRISKIDKAAKQLITLDLLIVSDDKLDIWTDRELIHWKEGQTSVVSRDSLIKMKKIAGRPQDLVDIEKLEEVANEN
jgi:hypothetical protein